MFKKVKHTRAFVCLLLMFCVLFVWGYAENAAQAPVDGAAEAAASVEETLDTPAPEADTLERDLAAVNGDTDFAGGTKRVIETQEGDAGATQIDFVSGMVAIWESTGLANGDWQQYVMIAVACVLLYLAIAKGFEPLLLLPIAFGMLLANLPLGGLMDEPSFNYFATLQEAQKYAAPYGKEVTLVSKMFWEVGDQVFTSESAALAAGFDAALPTCTRYFRDLYQVANANGGLFYYLYQGVKLGIYPPLIFMGVGAMTDFAPLIANPKSLLLGAAAQLGIFIAFILARLLGFTSAEASSIGIIGGADGPTAIFVTTHLAPHLLGAIAVAAYSYMALVPVIQPPIMRALTTKKERSIVMQQLRPVSKRELVIFPIAVTVIVSLLLPSAAPLIGMLMFGNLLRVSGVTERLSKTAQNELMNIVTIFLGTTVGATATASTFLSSKTLGIIVVGVLAFGFGTAGGVLLAKLMNKLSGGKINPLIGSAGVSAVPMAARVSQVEGQKANPGNFLLMHAMGPNVAGVIGSAIAAGILLSMFG